LNLTLIADYYKSIGETCEVDGNKLTFLNGNEKKEYTYNSNGLLTKYEWKSSGNLAMRWQLVGAGDDSINYLILIPIIGGISVAVIATIIIIYRKKFRKT